MRRAEVAALLLLIPLLPAACSSSESAPAAVDAGGDAYVARLPPPPPADAGADVSEAGVDCTKDVLGDGLPQHLACTDFFTADKKAFTPGLVFWSDGAEKQRWVVFPAGGKIDITSFDEWKLPVGTELWKEFAFGGKKIETRLFKKLAAGWKHTTYRWNDAQTEAVRKDSGEQVALPGRTPFEVPTSSQCDFCHTAHDEPVLGFDAVGLGVPGAQGVTLASLAADGMFATPAPVTSLTIPDDATGKAAAAMGWTHANCGSCHSDHLGAGAAGTALRFQLRASALMIAASAAELPAYVTGYCKPSERVDPNTNDYYRFVAGGSPSASLASLLANARAPVGQESIVTQMPPILSHVIDPTGVPKLDTWIAALAPCP